MIFSFRCYFWHKVWLRLDDFLKLLLKLLKWSAYWGGEKTDIMLRFLFSCRQADFNPWKLFWSDLFCFFLSPRCKVCPLTFLTKSEMQIHSKSHTEAKPHKCPHCSKTFANASYLSQHLRIHLGIKPYHCSYCENSFRQLSHLQQHTRLVKLWTWSVRNQVDLSCLCGSTVAHFKSDWWSHITNI